VDVDNSPRAERGAVVFRVFADEQVRFQSRTIRERTRTPAGRSKAFMAKGCD
jgi:hypothetical protein